MDESGNVFTYEARLCMAAAAPFNGKLTASNVNCKAWEGTPEESSGVSGK